MLVVHHVARNAVGLYGVVKAIFVGIDGVALGW